MSSKKKDKSKMVRLEFIGNNAIGVTGSSILVTAFDYKLGKDVNILLELGSVQEKSILDNYRANETLLNKFDAKNIDYIVISHSHQDHSGIAVGVIPKSFSGKILTTKESKAILPVMWRDSAHIIEEEAKWLKDKKGIKAKPFYKASDIYIAEGLIQVIEPNVMTELTPNIKIRFLENKHICGAIVTELFFQDQNSRTHKLVYTSDLGNVKNEPSYFTYETQPPSKNATVAIYESTYGRRSSDIITKKLRQKELELLEKTFENTLLDKEGICLLPIFSLHRTPVMLKYIIDILNNNDKLNGTKIIVDGNLSNDLLDVYSKICTGKNKEYIDEVLNYENLIRIRGYKETLCHLDDREPKIILGSSGFCDKGRIQLWLRQLLPQKKNTIIFTGYSSPNSVATKIKNKSETGQKSIKIDKFTPLMNAETVCLNSFSSHIQRDDLLNYIKQTNISDCAILVHGELNGREELAEDLQKIYDDEGITTKIIIPKKNQILYF